MFAIIVSVFVILFVALASADLQPVVLRIETDTCAFRQRPQDVLELARRDREALIVAGFVCRALSRDLDLEVGGDELDALGCAFKQYVGKDRQSMALFDDAGYRLERLQQGVAIYL